MSSLTQAQLFIKAVCEVLTSNQVADFDNDIMPLITWGASDTWTPSPKYPDGHHYCYSFGASGMCEVWCHNPPMTSNSQKIGEKYPILRARIRNQGNEPWDWVARDPSTGQCSLRKKRTFSNDDAFLAQTHIVIKSL